MAPGPSPRTHLARLAGLDLSFLGPPAHMPPTPPPTDGGRLNPRRLLQASFPLLLVLYLALWWGRGRRDSAVHAGRVDLLAGFVTGEASKARECSSSFPPPTPRTHPRRHVPHTKHRHGRYPLVLACPPHRHQQEGFLLPASNHPLDERESPTYVSSSKQQACAAACTPPLPSPAFSSSSSPSAPMPLRGNSASYV